MKTSNVVKAISIFFFLIIPRPPRSPLFPHTTLFRSFQLCVDRGRVFRDLQDSSNAGKDSHHIAVGSVALEVVRAIAGRDRVSHRNPARHPEHLTARKDRKSTRLNSSHSQISNAVFCL